LCLSICVVVLTSISEYLLLSFISGLSMHHFQILWFLSSCQWACHSRGWLRNGSKLRFGKVWDGSGGCSGEMLCPAGASDDDTHGCYSPYLRHRWGPALCSYAWSWVSRWKPSPSGADDYRILVPKMRHLGT
jgi:hypothetical protein